MIPVHGLFSGGVPHDSHRRDANFRKSYFPRLSSHHERNGGDGKNSRRCPRRVGGSNWKTARHDAYHPSRRQWGRVLHLSAAYPSRRIDATLARGTRFREALPERNAERIGRLDPGRASRCYESSSRAPASCEVVNPQYALVARRANHRCEYSRAPEFIFNSPFEVEHIVPTSRGGESEVYNYALACRSCNGFKSNATTGRDLVTDQEAELFHPRRDRWNDHFSLDLLTGVISGLTLVGRATINRLKMNDPQQVLARLTWIELRLFP